MGWGASRALGPLGALRVPLPEGFCPTQERLALWAWGPSHPVCESERGFPFLGAGLGTVGLWVRRKAVSACLLHFCSSFSHLFPRSVGPDFGSSRRGCTNSIGSLTCGVAGLSFGMVNREALPRPARNTCECGRDLVSSLPDLIYKASRGRGPRAALQTWWQPPCFRISWRTQDLNLNKKYTKLGLQWVFKLVGPFLRPHLPYLPLNFATPTLALFDFISSEKYTKQPRFKSFLVWNLSGSVRADDEVDVDGTVEEDLGKSREGSRTDDEVVQRFVFFWNTLALMNTGI